MNKLVFLGFAREMYPYVLELLRMLFVRHGGDPKAAAAELRRITDYGRRGEAAEAGFRERIADVEQRFLDTIKETPSSKKE